MKRIVFLDYLRVIAIFMVLVIHSTEPYYFGSEGGVYVASHADALWVTFFEILCRACVPLFVMASAYLLFPVTKPTGEFLKRRLVRVFLPFALWCCIYTWWNGGDWGRMLFNFPLAAGGHLWFVPMMFGVYLLMPLLSPWAEQASEKEVRGWLLAWGFSTLIPFARVLFAVCYGHGFNHLFGEADFDKIPFLWGECGWNGFGTFHYMSGFFGYLLMGFWFRKFAGLWTWGKTFLIATMTGVLGAAVMGVPFLAWMTARAYPLADAYPFAVSLETSIEYCSLGVALITFAWFAIIRKLSSEGHVYHCLIRPLSDASYGVYLVHILILVPISASLKSNFPTPISILATAAATFAMTSLGVVLVKRIPVLRMLV